MNHRKLSLDEGPARFWTTVFGGITTLGPVAAGIYSLVQYFDGKEHDRENIKLQVEIAGLAAKQSFNTKHLELCAQAALAASTIAGIADKKDAKRREKKEEFWQLYWGPFGIVERDDVARAMVDFGKCLHGDCEGSLQFAALNIAHACRKEVSADFEISLPSVPRRTVGP